MVMSVLLCLLDPGSWLELADECISRRPTCPTSRASLRILSEPVGEGGLPSYEFVYVDAGSLFTNADGVHFARHTLWQAIDDKALPSALSPVTFSVVGQVRADYASRFLQRTGAWLSRIDVDVDPDHVLTDRTRIRGGTASLASLLRQLAMRRPVAVGE
jgi:hypothetical protein